MSKKTKDVYLSEKCCREWRLRGINRNTVPYEGGVILFHPGMRELIRIAFGTGENLDQDDCDIKDSHGNFIDDYMYISTFGDLHLGDFAEELEASEKDGGQMLFSHKTFKSGDIREMLTPALDFMGWPDSADEYVFMSGEGLCEQP